MHKQNISISKVNFSKSADSCILDDFAITHF